MKPLKYPAIIITESELKAIALHSFSLKEFINSYYFPEIKFLASINVFYLLSNYVRIL